MFVCDLTPSPSPPVRGLVSVVLLRSNKYDDSSARYQPTLPPLSCLSGCCSGDWRLYKIVISIFYLGLVTSHSFFTSQNLHNRKTVLKNIWRDSYFSAVIPVHFMLQSNKVENFEMPHFLVFVVKLIYYNRLLQSDNGLKKKKLETMPDLFHVTALPSVS